MCHVSWRGCKGFALLYFFVILLMNSCAVPKNVLYFNDLKNDSTYPQPIVRPQTVKFQDPRIEPNDVLAVTIQTVTQNESNVPIAAAAPGSADPRTGGYLVDKNGYIELTLIGFVKVGGLTTAEAKELIKQKAKEFYRDPVINVRIINFEITVSGDVGKPGIVNVPSEKASVMEVLALAGDANLSANHRNVLLIRTENNERKFVRLDLTKSSIFNSPYLYVKQRDMIYVEPNRAKVEASDNRILKNLGIFTGVLSIVSLLFVFKIIK